MNVYSNAKVKTEPRAFASCIRCAEHRGESGLLSVAAKMRLRCEHENRQPGETLTAAHKSQFENADATRE